LGIPDFYLPQYETLIYSLSRGTCIFFGAGLSQLAGYKSWVDLRKSMITYFWERRSEIPYDRRKLFDYSSCEDLLNHENDIEAFTYLDYLSNALFVKGIKDIFYTDEQDSNNKIFSFLNRLNNGNNFYVTTNIDRGFQKHISLPDEHVSINPEFKNPPKIINYLHGRVDREDTWVFTRDKYNIGYIVDESPCMKFLQSIFENYNVLFIGYGLREGDINRVISSTSRKKHHFWLEPSSRSKEGPLKIRSTCMRENYNVHLIPYFIDEEGYDLLLKTIEALSTVVSAKLRGI